MSLVDAFGREDRTEVKFSQFFALVKQAAQYEILMNAVNCDVPHRFIKETMTGKKETAPKEPGTVVTVTFDTEEFEKGLQGVIEQIQRNYSEQRMDHKAPSEVRRSFRHGLPWEWIVGRYLPFF